MFTLVVNYINCNHTSPSNLILILAVQQLLPSSVMSTMAFAKVFTHLSNPSKEFGDNRLFQLDLDEALGKDAAYMAKPSLPGLLMATQVIMNT